VKNQAHILDEKNTLENKERKLYQEKLQHMESIQRQQQPPPDNVIGYR
jgi:hypothetical protein